ncbi:hypothetical protein BPTFM16_02261 [Altererythrobacter insulae]|nr:hypothetical protein BPTFM16_02261 [Altererythrobacter insulae]
MGLRASLALALCSGALAHQPALANERVLDVEERSAQSAFHQRLALDQRLQDIGWKLVSGNAAFCDNAGPAVGLQLHDMASYGKPDAVRELLGLSSDIAVLTAAEGSPAAEAGLTANQELVAIAGSDPRKWISKSRRDWERTKRMHDWIDQKLSEEGAVSITLADRHSVVLEPRLACSTRFELGGDNKRAMAEGTRVIFGSRFPGFGYVEDEFAAAIAHELAHNVLQHRAWLDANGRKRSNVRLVEREADRLMPWLLANAGYDPAAAARFMERWGPVHDGGIFRARTHDGWDERVEFITAEVDKIKELRSNGTAADWSSRFEREIEF